jgi:energy-coupling factor transporter transmembrane protein EcfT
MQAVGAVLCIITYLLLGVHVFGFFAVIAKVLKKRLGVIFGLIWIAIGISLLYNIVFNHFLAMLIKPGGPRDLAEDEALRKEIKNRDNRKAPKVNLNDGLSTSGARKGTAEQIIEDDRYDGL